MDHVLAPFHSSPHDTQSEHELGELLKTHAAPLVRRIVCRRLGASSDDIDDVCSQVLTALMLRLRRERTDANLTAIDNFASYVATAAHHGCDHFLRARYPLRWRLRNRLRYVLEHDARFGLWSGREGVATCGLAEWRLRDASGAAPSASELATVPREHTRELLTRAFQLSGAPIELTAVVSAAADAWAIPLFQHDGSDGLDTVPHPGHRPDAPLDQRARLERIWSQIRDLPVRQRHALLLNLRDDAITLFLTTGAASMRELAAALEWPAEQLAAVWNDLPLPDNAIAERLGCTRQQVINLRMAARKRLANRLGPEINMGAARVL